MYVLFVTLVFSLALGPDVKLLNAEQADETMQTQQPTVSSQVTDSSTGVNTIIEAEETTMGNKDLTTRNLLNETEKVEQTSPESTLLTTPEPTATPVSTIITTYDLSTSEAPPVSMPEEPTMINITTPEPPQTPSPSPSISDPPTSIPDTLVVTSAPASDEDLETTSTLITAPPTPTTTTTTTILTTPPITTTTTILTTPPITTTTTILTTPPITTTTTILTTPPITTTPTPIIPTQEQTTLINHDTDSSSHPEDMRSTPSNTTSLSGAVAGKDSKPNWLIITVIALVIFCILTPFCIAGIIFKRRKQSGKQYFGQTNGQRSKKKKGVEDDVWAGPVTLGGVDCENPEEGDAQGEEKKPDGVEVTGLSTFSTLEENGGVGRPGSPEVEKWEEKEPLLFIDEEGKEKGKEAGKSEDANTKGGAEKANAKEAEPNGGETFCLTTAV